MPIEAIQQQATDGRPHGRRHDHADPEQAHGLAPLIDGKNLEHQHHGQWLYQTGAQTLEHPPRDHDVDIAAQTTHEGADGEDRHGTQIGRPHPERTDRWTG